MSHYLVIWVIRYFMYYRFAALFYALANVYCSWRITILNAHSRVFKSVHVRMHFTKNVFLRKIKVISLCAYSHYLLEYFFTYFSGSFTRYQWKLHQGEPREIGYSADSSCESWLSGTTGILVSRTLLHQLVWKTNVECTRPHDRRVSAGMY